MSVFLYSYQELSDDQKKVVDEVLKSFEGKPVGEAHKVISVIRQKVNELSVVKSPGH